MSDLLNDFINQCASDCVNSKEYAPTRTTDPVTSFLAAESVSGLSEKRRAVLWVVQSFHSGASDAQIAERYEEFREEFSRFYPAQSPSGLRTRRHELQLAGAVRDSGRRSKTPSGRSCVIWTVCEENSPA